jgi:hypothetical protein
MPIHPGLVPLFIAYAAVRPDTSLPGPAACQARTRGRRYRRVGHNKLDESRAVVVRFNRKKGVAFGLLFAALFGSALGRLIDGSASVGVVLSLSPLGLWGFGP